MSVNVNYKEKLGEIEVEVYDYENNETTKFKCDIWGSNCLFASTYDKDEKRYIALFACDETHLKNMLGLSKGYENIFKDFWFGQQSIKFKFNAKHPKLWNIVKLLVKSGITCEIYNEEEI